MVVFLSLCLCGGVFVVVFLWWCFCGGVFVLVFLWWCFCGGVFVVVFLWCGCGGVFVAVFCGGVQKYCSSTTKYYSSTTKYYSSTTPYYSSTTPYYKVLLQYYSDYKVLLQYHKVLLRTTKCYSSTTKYYSAQQSNTPVLTTKVLLHYYSVLHRPLKRRQNDVLPVLLRTTPVLQKLPKRAFRARLPQLFTERASKMIVSCKASSKFHRTSFQNERFARCFRQFSQKKLPKGSFRAMLLPNFTDQASKTSVSCEASSKFHRTMLPKRAFCAMLPTIFPKNLRFAAVSRNRQTDSHERVHPPKAKYRESSPRANEICVSLQFWAIDTTFLPRGFTASK